MYLLNSVPSRKNGPRTQQALEVTSRYAGAPPEDAASSRVELQSMLSFPIELERATQTGGQQGERGVWSSESESWCGQFRVVLDCGQVSDLLVPQCPCMYMGRVAIVFTS